MTDYALDLNCFHKESHDKLLVPILICTNAQNTQTDISVEGVLIDVQFDKAGLKKMGYELCMQKNLLEFI